MNEKKRAIKIMADVRKKMMKDGYTSEIIFSIAAFEEIAMEINSTTGDEHDYWCRVMDEKNKLEES